MNKVTTIRIDQDLLEQVQVQSEIEERTQTDFLNRIIKEGMNTHKILLTGGAVMALPNPQLYEDDLEKIRETEAILRNARKEIEKIHCSFPYESLILQAELFLATRRAMDTEEERAKYRINYILENGARKEWQHTERAGANTARKR